MMGLLLKSNKTAVNPDIDWQYSSLYGPTHKEVADYIASISARGFLPSRAEFSGLDAFVTGMKASGLWGKVKEIAPLFGGDYQGVLTKLKSDWSSAPLTAVNGDTILNYEASGGRYLGRDQTAFQALAGPALKTGFTASHLNEEWGFVAYLDSTTAVSDTQLNRIIMGVSHNAGSIQQTEARLNYSAGMAGVFMRTGASSNVSGGETVAALSRIGCLRWSARRSSADRIAAKTYHDGVLNGEASLVYVPTLDRDRDVWLGAKNPFNPPDTASWGFDGKLRFAAWDDGTMSDFEVVTYNNLVADLMTALGKAF